MKPFLKQVAGHYYQKGDIQNTCFVFPSRRSVLFFKKYLCEIIAASGASKAMFAPEMITVNEFFFRCGGLAETDKVRLIIDLYESYRKLLPDCEPLDDFIFWGDVLLGDFDDVDKYLVDAKGLFANVADFKSMTDNFSYLSPTQRDAMNRFVGNFENEAEYKTRFLRIWNILYPLYEDFRKRLSGSGMAYEGMVYRSLAESKEPVVDVMARVFPKVEHFAFVGLNVLSESEKKVLARMRDAGIASFCWDYKGKEVRDPVNRSSLFMKDNVRLFPSAFETDPDGLPETSYEAISVPSSMGQAKLLPELLKGSAANPIATAVILPDEGLLDPVLSSIPPEFTSVNVTMGRPMKGSALFSLMSEVAAMQLHLRPHGDLWYFYHRQVRSIFSSGILRKVLTEEEEETVRRIIRGGKFYIPQADFGDGELMKTIFRPVAKDLKNGTKEQVAALAAYVRDVVIAVASRMRAREGMMLELDFAKRYVESVGRLAAIELEVRPATWFRLLDRVLAVSSVPFNGEPLEGLQIMGPLETRALDFEKVIILSANEGIFPHRSVSSSFIPPELRKGFALPTYEMQDSVWAYYFYRLIQRASKVIMVSDTRTEGIKTGEESRYIKQLKYHFGVPLVRKAAVSAIAPSEVSDKIEKTEADIEALKAYHLSATALKNYLTCPAKFYYSSVKRLKQEDEVAESIDTRLLGNVFHGVLEEMYGPIGRIVTIDELLSLRNDKEGLLRRIDERICKELKSVEVTGRDLVTREVIQKYILDLLKADCDYLKARGVKGMKILGLEADCKGEMCGFNFVGKIDRIDSVRDGIVRVVDYKTGKVSDIEREITDANTPKIINEFTKKTGKKPEIALQMYLYDRFFPAEIKGSSVIVNSVYSVSHLPKEGVLDCPVSDVFLSEMEKFITGKLTEIADLSIPFNRSGKSDNECKYCDFKMLCGR
ncbi:MAG: PD-(D/E)XK nuclease family protein [Bacteroidales bacterium]|nr:PD-(D/E)XK nuclease family protein [Bacteroidales bacterium]